MKKLLFISLAAGCIALLCGALAGETVKIEDIRISFAKPPVRPPFGAPRDALDAGIKTDPDAAKGGSSGIKFGVVKTPGELGPIAKIAVGRVKALTVTWADPKRFETEGQAGDLLRELLSSPNTRSFSFHIWSWGDVEPSLVATVEHTAGKPGKWIVWCPPPALYWAYQDGNGQWWWGDWDVLKAPTPKSLEQKSDYTVTRLDEKTENNHPENFNDLVVGKTIAEIFGPISELRIMYVPESRNAESDKKVATSIRQRIDGSKCLGRLPKAAWHTRPWANGFLLFKSGRIHEIRINLPGITIAGLQFGGP